MALISPEFWVDDVAKAMDYYERVLGFKRLRGAPGPDGVVTHGDMQLGDSNPLVFTTTERGRPGSVDAVLDKLALGGPRGTGFLLLIDVGEMDIDSYYKDLVGKGVKIIEPLEDKPYGARMFRIEDRDGYILSFSKRIRRQ